MSENKIGCHSIPCASCPYRRDVPSGIWVPEEYSKLPPYDAETFQQPAALFMCHSNKESLCTGWLQSHANRDHRFDLLALRMNHTKLDGPQVSEVALMEPVVKLFSTGVAAAKHGMKGVDKPGKKAKKLMKAIAKKRQI